MDKFEHECQDLTDAIEQIEVDPSEGRSELRGDFEAFVAKVSIDQLDKINRESQRQETLKLAGDIVAVVNNCSTIAMATAGHCEGSATLGVKIAAGTLTAMSGIAMLAINKVKQKRAGQCSESQNLTDVSQHGSAAIVAETLATMSDIAATLTVDHQPCQTENDSDKKKGSRFDRGDC